MRGLRFWKYHGLGNDFVILEDLSGALRLSSEEVRVICNRRRGVGADGVLILRKRDDTYFMQTLNSDGSEAEMCGNGIRCAGKHLFDTGRVGKRFEIDTLAGRIKLEHVSGNGETSMFRVGMGRPVFEREKIPMLGRGRCIDEEITIEGRKFKVTALSLGNPHAVVFEGMDMNEVEHWGALIESHSCFPRRTNVDFTRVVNENEIEVCVYERGCGVTQACGTGACASVVAGTLRGVLSMGKPVVVHLPGGDLQVEVEPGYTQVWMTGPATFVFSGVMGSAKNEV